MNGNLRLFRYTREGKQVKQRHEDTVEPRITLCLKDQIR